MQNTTAENDKLADSDMDDALDDMVIDERADLDVNLNILDTSSASDDTEIVDDMNADVNVEDQDIGSSQEILCSQMVRVDPYAKKPDSDIVKDAQVTPVDDPDNLYSPGLVICLAANVPLLNTTTLIVCIQYLLGNEYKCMGIYIYTLMQ